MILAPGFQNNQTEVLDDHETAFRSSLLSFGRTRIADRLPRWEGKKEAQKRCMFCVNSGQHLQRREYLRFASVRMRSRYQASRRRFRIRDTRHS